MEIIDFEGLEFSVTIKYQKAIDKFIQKCNFSNYEK
jgi:hypothetical protein